MVHVHAGGCPAELCSGCALVFAAQSREAQISHGKKEKPMFPSVCGHQAAHRRQKGKLYQCNFPRQTSHNSVSLKLPQRAFLQLLQPPLIHFLPSLSAASFITHYKTYSWTSLEKSHLSTTAPLAFSSSYRAFSARGPVPGNKHRFVHTQHSPSTSAHCLPARQGLLWPQPAIEMSLCDVAIATLQLNRERAPLSQMKGSGVLEPSLPGTDSGDGAHPQPLCRVVLCPEPWGWVDTEAGGCSGTAPFICTYLCVCLCIRSILWSGGG